MKQKYVIKQPYIVDATNPIICGSDCKRICSDVLVVNPDGEEKKQMFFEVEKNFSDGFEDNRSDAFVMGLLIAAMEKNYDIEFEAPMSEKLLFQIRNQFIPLVSKYNPKWLNPINISGPTSNEKIYNAGAVATGCSGGVDSFYTIEKYGEREKIKSFRLTHLVFSSIGTTDYNHERIVSYFNHTLSKMKPMAEELGLKAIGIYTNVHEFYAVPYKAFSMFYATTYASCAYALQRLLRVYYINAGYPITEFKMDVDKAGDYDGSIFDVFTLGCMDTETQLFYLTGIEMDRADRINYIADNKVAQKYLTTCGLEQGGVDMSKYKYRNCGHCRKCLPAQVHLYAGKNLDKFGAVFDIDDFYKHKTKKIAKMMAIVNPEYRKQAIRLAKKNGVDLPVGSFALYYFHYKPLFFLMRIFKENRWIRKIYYLLKIDVLIYGHRSSKYDAFIKEKEKVNNG